MKLQILIVAAVVASASALAQGTVNFNNRITGQVDAPVWAWGQTGTAGWGIYPDNHAQLFRVTGNVGSGMETYTPIGQATTFRAPTAANPLLAAYINPISSMIVDGVAASSQISVVMRVWLGASYDAASFKGQSPIAITITLGGDIPNQPPAPAALLIGLQGFELVPEPSIAALGILGVSALLFRRRN